VDWGEAKVEGQEEIPNSWFSSSLEEGDNATSAASDWRKLPDFQQEPKLKQLELNFSRIFEKPENIENIEKSGEDGKRMETKNSPANKPKLKKDQDEVQSDKKPVYRRNKGKISKKESLAIAAKNKKVSSWLRNETRIRKEEREEINTIGMETEIEHEMEWTDPVVEQERSERKREAGKRQEHFWCRGMV
jgi:hypothetical protein